MQIKDNVRQRYPFLAFYNGFRCIISTCFGRLIIDLLRHVKAWLQRENEAKKIIFSFQVFVEDQI